MHRVSIVVSDYRKELTHKMLEFAIKKAKALGAEVKEAIHVPGALETPLAAKKALENRAEAVVVLAVVLQGGTMHDVMVAENAYRKLSDLSIEFGRPVCVGIIGPRVSEEKAKKRLKQYAEHAVEAAVKTA